MVMVRTSAQAEEGQDGQDDHDETDEIDDTVHLGSDSVLTQLDESQSCDTAFWLRACSILAQRHGTAIARPSYPG
jgi:hypothetical protein